MLDTRFTHYQDAVIGTVLTTLHAGSVLLTFYPNFKLSLQDTNLSTALKVQVQIQGAEQISSAKIATLHYQLVYRLQNHASDLPTPEHHSNALMVLAESDQIPTIIQIPRQIPRHELIKLMPLECISNYEKFHTNTSPIQTIESMFERRSDGTVRMTFRPPSTAPEEPPQLSFTYSAMVTAVQTAQEKLPITGFNSERYPIYPAKFNGHFLWDSPCSGNCDPDCPCWDDWEPQQRRKPKKKIPKTPCSHNQTKPPHNPPPPPPSPLPIYRKELRWIAKNCKIEVLPHIQNSKQPIHPMACVMFSSTSQDYSSNFPALETQTDPQRKVITKPFISSAITPTGHLEDPKPFEAVLNWQTQNARAQNETLVDIHTKVNHISLLTDHIESKMDSITSHMQQIYQNLQSRISQLDSELRTMLSHRYYGPDFDKKEKEIRKLKAELEQIESERQRPSLFTTSSPLPTLSPAFHPFAPMLSPIKPQDPDYEKSHADITRILMVQPKETERAQSSRTDPFFEIPSDIEEDPPETSSASNRPAQPQNDHKPSNGPWFTFDDIPIAKWRNRLSELATWTDLQMLRANATTASVLRELATRFTGPLRDWFDTLGEYRQLQFMQLPNVSTALSVIHEQFIRESAAVFEAARRDYLNMKCYSLNSKDLDFHYKRMSILFYKLNGFNDPTLKHVFLASLPEELQPDIQRQLTSLNLTIDNIFLGKIFQIAKGYKAIRLLEHLQATADYSPHQDEIEFYFSEQEEPTNETMFALQNSSDDSENDEFQTIFHQQLLSLDTTIHIPSIKLHILPTKFQRPIPAIGLLDTGAQRSTQDDHRHLLNQFFDIIQSHGIMLSAKKSTIATNSIEFLGMTIKDALLKKNPPSWNNNHTLAVTMLKQIAQNPPPLKLITDGRRILQTDASDESWGAILLEETDGKEHFIGYARGHFSDTQIHYHSVFKEILAVKHAILEQDDKVQKELYISHTSLGPQHDIIMIPTPSAISKPKSTGIIIKEEKLDFTNFLYQDAQDPWEAFLPLSQHLQNLQQTPPTHASDDPTNKASSSTPTGSKEHPSSSWRKIFCPWPPCRPDHQHPPETPCPSLKVMRPTTHLMKTT
ncbi:hypothetical protein KPL70_023280 [Citrus sinensis]|nr:hypothetical protein KPL70_023280 [Citrus sinensis]